MRTFFLSQAQCQLGSSAEQRCPLHQESGAGPCTASPDRDSRHRLGTHRVKSYRRVPGPVSAVLRLMSGCFLHLNSASASRASYAHTHTHRQARTVRKSTAQHCSMQTRFPSPLFIPEENRGGNPPTPAGPALPRPPADSPQLGRRLQAAAQLLRHGHVLLLLLLIFLLLLRRQREIGGPQLLPPGAAQGADTEGAAVQLPHLILGGGRHRHRHPHGQGHGHGRRPAAPAGACSPPSGNASRPRGHTRPFRSWRSAGGCVTSINNKKWSP